jgi:GalNAc-alpha-(1->4)-GalNAc-alpha-(1->3)-diNAcBac-PP-undecaprenol alpha-1,4-N-acetyl-D-galactosaminyltransferase
MRLTIIMSSLGLGGAERVTASLANAWAALGHDVTVLLLASPEAPRFFETNPGIRVQALSLLGDSRNPVAAAFRNVGRAMALRKAIRVSRPDAVIGFAAETNILTLLATRGLDVSVAVADCADPKVFPINPLWRALRPLTYRMADHIVCQTRGTRVALGDPPRAVVIGNPVESGSPPETPPEPIVVAAGRFVPEKGFDLLIDAFARIAGEIQPWRLVIYGDGPGRAELTAQAAAAGIADRVVLPGAVKNLPAFLSRAAVFALPSRTEGFGNALAEAMAVGRPVAAFDCPTGPGELIRDGETGILVPAADPAALATALRRLISDGALRARLGSAAAEAMHAFRPETIARAWIDLIAATRGGEGH